MRILALALNLVLALTQGCTTDSPSGQTEPLAPEIEATPYPEDPDMAKGEDAVDTSPAAGDESAPSSGETVGELSSDPFSDAPPAAPPAEDDGNEPLAETPLPEPDSGDPYDGAFEDDPPKFEPSPDGPDLGLPPDMSDTSKPVVATQSATTRYVRGILVNVRAKPSFKSPIVRRLLGGATIQVTGHGGWSRIRDGQWIRSKLLSTSPTRKVSRAEADKAWRDSKYKDRWKPGKKASKSKK